MKEKIGDVWKNRKKEIANTSKNICLIISLFLIGIIFAQALDHYMSDILIGICFLFLLLLLNSMVWLKHLKLDTKLKKSSYLEKETYFKLLYYKQNKILLVCLGLTAIILILDRVNELYIRPVLLGGNGDYYPSIVHSILLYNRQWILIAVFLFIPVCITIIFYYHYKKRINPLQRELALFEIFIENVQLGKEEHSYNPFPEQSTFYHWACILEDIKKEATRAVEQKIKGEKMKVELITNISHDLKTPLTSIVNYLELIKKEAVSDDINDYIELISTKVFKLKEMIESLFDLSKTATGNAEFKMETMDMNRLVEQILADMQNLVQDSQQIWKIDLSEMEVLFVADSNAMYQVCQNLFVNALKYSLEGTRVFITTKQEQDKVKLQIINTANYQMNFTAEDIVERFVRGDLARTTEGNGLGLAIAKTYTEACHGTFDLEVRGDQFYIELTFQKQTISD